MFLQKLWHSIINTHGADQRVLQLLKYNQSSCITRGLKADYEGVKEALPLALRTGTKY